MGTVGCVGPAPSAPPLATDSELPAAFTGDVAALCIATWDCEGGAKEAGSPNACCSSAGAAAASAACGTLLLAGIGSQLLVYELPSGRLLCCTTALPDAARLHGVAWLPCRADASGRPALLVAVHGGRHAALLRLLGPLPPAASNSCVASTASWELQLLRQLRFVEWTMDVQLAPVGGCIAQMAVGLSSNAVQLFAVNCSGSGSSGSGSDSSAAGPRCAVQQLGQVECSDRSLLYSMALLPRQPPELDSGNCGDSGSGRGGCDGNGSGGDSGSGSGSRQAGPSWLVAAGTILHNVLVWAVPAPPPPPPAAAGPGGSMAAPAFVLPSAQRAVVAPLFRLKGHMGSVHSVCWSPCGRLLASGSDDRSLRLWSIPQPLPAAAQAPSGSKAGAKTQAGGAEQQASATELQPLHTLWGHGGRLWGCAFGGGTWAAGGSSSSIGGGGGGGSSSGLGGFLVTASEDCTCRVWCLATGRQLAAVEGHRGRGPWSCALLPRLGPAASALAAAARTADSDDAAATAADHEAAAAAAAAGCYFLTGGADASIKCWTLADWLPPPAALQAATANLAPAAAVPVAAAECITLQGLPPCPDATEVGQSCSYELRPAQCSAQQAQQADQLQQEQQGEDGGSAPARDSRAEWARCLALASSSSSSNDGESSSSSSRSSGSRGDGSASQEWRRRWLYVATNRGLVHRVHLPDATQGLPERWECIHKASSSGDARPFLALRVLSEPACTAGQLGCGGSHSCAAECGSPVWLALSDLAGTAAVLLDRPGGSSGSNSSGSASDGASDIRSTLCIAQWRPYSGTFGPAGLWWGSPTSGGSSAGGSLADARGLGSRYCFTTGGKQLLTAWLLPPLSSCDPAPPKRLAEAQLPFAGYANAVAAALLPSLQPEHAAALVAVGDSTGGVTVLLLVLPGGLQRQQQQPERAVNSGPAGTDGAAAHLASCPAGGGSGARLVHLAAARRVHAGTPVRALQLRLPAATSSASPQERLAEAEVVTAGGDGAVHTLRLPPASVAAALGALAAVEAQVAPQPAVEEALAGPHLQANGTEAAVAEPVASQPQAAEAAGPAAEPCSLPRLLAAASRRYEAVTHIEGILPPPAGGSGGGSSSSSSSSGGSCSSGGLVYGFHASHFAVWDEGADAQVAQVQCGGWRRPSAADVAAADDLAFCVLHNGSLWLYRRRPDPCAPPRCLHPPHHCKEQHCVRLLALPGAAGCTPGDNSSSGGGADAAASLPAGPAAVCCITGGEDATVRQLLLPLLQHGHSAAGIHSSGSTSGSGSGTLFSFAGLLAEQARGTAVKSLALLPLRAPQPPGQLQWLLLSAGARQTLLLSRLRQQEGRGDSGRPLPLLCDELAVKDPVASDKRTPRSQSLKLWSDLRYLAVSAFLVPRTQQGRQQQQQQQEAGWPVAGSLAAAGAAHRAAAGGNKAAGQPPAAQQPLLFVVAAASDASLELLCADLAAMPRQLGTGRRPEQFPAVARLAHHTCPVLSTAHRCLQLPAGGLGGGDEASASLDASAGTPTAPPSSSSSSSSSRSSHHIAFSGTTDGVVAVWDVSAAVEAAAAPPGGAAQQAQQAQLELAPLLVLPGLHQSGVNCMAVVPAGEGLLLLITGGDDQALGLTLLQLDVHPAPPGMAGRCGVDPSSSGSGGGGAGSGSCRELLRLAIPNAHSSALRSVWASPLAAASTGSSRLGAAAGAAAAQPAGAAAPTAGGGTAGGTVDQAALQATVFTLGLDQQVRRWRLQLQPCRQERSAAQPAAEGGTSGSAGSSSGIPELPLGALDRLDEVAAPGEPWLEDARYSASSAPSCSPSSDGGGGSPGWRISAEETGCRFTQVAEPAALDVLPRVGGEAAALPGPRGRFLVAVAGRGSQLLAWG